MKDSPFISLKYIQVASFDSRELILKEQPAIYAWYRSYDCLFDIESPEEFILKLEALLKSKLSEKYSGKLGYLYDISIQEVSGCLSSKKTELLTRISRNENFRYILAEILNEASPLQSPLYIGKAINLKTRISEHVNGYSGLRSRFEEADINMNECILRYKYIDTPFLESFNQEKDDVVVLIEDLLTRLSPAAFVKRPG